MYDLNAYLEDMEDYPEDYTDDLGCFDTSLRGWVS
jgi:hypothetical protein